MKQAVRIQTSVLNTLEKKALVAMAKRCPRWITSDFMTFLGFVGAIVIALGYILSDYNINFLWLASFGLFINWIGDSMDGTLARVRKEERPVYGFFVDHMMDGINETIMIVGAGLSALVDFRLAILMLVFYLLLSIYVYISTYLKAEFKLTFAKMGPTELRLIVVVINTLFIYSEALRTFCLEIVFRQKMYHLHALDIAALIIAAMLAVMFVYHFVKDASDYACQEKQRKAAKLAATTLDADAQA